MVVCFIDDFDLGRRLLYIHSTVMATGLSMAIQWNKFHWIEIEIELLPLVEGDFILFKFDLIVKCE